MYSDAKLSKRIEPAESEESEKQGIDDVNSAIT